MAKQRVINHIGSVKGPVITELVAALCSSKGHCNRQVEINSLAEEGLPLNIIEYILNQCSRGVFKWRLEKQLQMI